MLVGAVSCDLLSFKLFGMLGCGCWVGVFGCDCGLGCIGRLVGVGVIGYVLAFALGA